MSAAGCDHVPTNANHLAGLEALREDVRVAQGMLSPSELGPQDIDLAWRILTVASDELVAMLLRCGVETPLGRRLHHLRNQLDAHLLAADALRDADAPRAAVNVLHRTVDFFGSEVETLFADAI